MSGDESFLSRWSKRKSQARSEVVAPVQAGVPSPVAPANAAAHSPDQAPAKPLPPVESLTPESDFTPFMKPEVDPGVKRQALKTLFQDPQFNVMDGLDVYIDDYSKPDPLPESWLAKLNQVARLGAYEEPLAEAEKPQPEQGLDSSPASEASDTADSGTAPPKVGQ